MKMLNTQYLKLVRRILGVALVLLISACATVNPVTGEKEYFTLNEKAEIKLGEQHYYPTMQSMGGEYLNNNEAKNYVNSIGQKLAQVSHRPNLNYEFKIVNSSMVNAFALPGGKICVTRGLLEQIDNEAQLASVLGHEIGHVTARHGAKRFVCGTILFSFLQFGGAVFDLKNVKGKDWIKLGAVLGTEAFLSKYSRDQETQSDTLGIDYMQKVNYDPHGAVQLFELFSRLSKKEPGFIEKLFASHPQSNERMQNANNIIKNKNTAKTKKIVNTLEFSQATATIKREASIYRNYDRAEKLSRDGRVEEAIEFYNKAIQEKSSESLFHASLGLAYLEREQSYQGEKYLKEAIRLYPDYYMPHYILGIHYLGERQYDGAIEYLEKTDKFIPEQPTTQFLLAQAYIASGGWFNQAKGMGLLRTVCLQHKYTKIGNMACKQVEILEPKKEAKK